MSKSLNASFVGEIERHRPPVVELPSRSGSGHTNSGDAGDSTGLHPIPFTSSFPFHSFLLRTVLRCSSVHPSDSDRSASHYHQQHHRHQGLVWWPAGRLGSGQASASHPYPIQCTREAGTPPAATIAAALCILLGEAGRLRWRPAALSLLFWVLTSDTHASSPDDGAE
jgi:hypothetical protein